MQLVSLTTAVDIAAGNDVDLPAALPDIDEVVSAQIFRPASAVSVDDHPAADIAGGVADHAAADIAGGVADHEDSDVAASIADQTLDTQSAVGGAVTTDLGHDAVPQLETAGGANVSIAGCISTHGGSGTDLAHAAGADVAHAAGSDVAHTAVTANGNVAVTATKSDEDTVTLDVDFEAGDILYLTYTEIGANLKVS
jgi:hypothetical protein